jgi:hypothetical protein
MATTYNALVTYTDLTTMGLVAIGTPAIGNRIATKAFIVSNYEVDLAPLSIFLDLQCPPYQYILPGAPPCYEPVGYVDDADLNAAYNFEVSFDYNSCYIGATTYSTAASGGFTLSYDCWQPDDGYLAYYLQYPGGPKVPASASYLDGYNPCTTTSTSTTIPPIPPSNKYALAARGNGDVYKSIDGGSSWSAIPFFSSIAFIENVKVSFTGQYMLATGYAGSSSSRVLYLSSDYGDNWSSIATAASLINDIAISDDGKYIVYVLQGSTQTVYISSNYGASFSTSGSPGASSWRGVAMSSTGQYITLTSFNSYIWVSSNYGVSYTAKTAYPSSGWIPVAMSKDGRYQLAGKNTIYRSNDYGNTWIDTGASGSNGWDALAISGDGQFGLAIAHGTQEIWKSTNQGANWNFLTAIGTGGSGNWFCCAIAPSASVQLVGANGNVWPSNFIWKSSNYGTSFSAVSLTDLSWQAISIGG